MCPTLPAEIYGVIAEFLVSEKKFESCANLNAVSHAVYEGTLPVLWRTVDLSNDFAARIPRSSSSFTVSDAGREWVLRWIAN